jgi:lipopolysaccharide transport system permease protein
MVIVGCGSLLTETVRWPVHKLSSVGARAGLSLAVVVHRAKRSRYGPLLMVLALPLLPVIAVRRTRNAFLRPAAAAQLGAEWTVIEPRQPALRYRLREVWQHRRLVAFLGRRLLEKMTRRTFLGLLWIPIRPLLTIGSRALVFGGLLAAPSAGLPYFLFFLTGMGAWNLFDRTLFWSARSIDVNGRLVKKLYFPRLLLPIAAFVPAILDFLVYATIGVVTLAGYWIADGKLYLRGSRELAYFPLGILLVFALALGIGLFVAVLGAYTRDVRFSLNFILGFWFFLTPVVYPLAAIPAKWKLLASLNPMSAPLEMIRLGLYGKGDLTTVSLASCLACTAVAVLGGLAFFSRWEASAVDVL